MSSGGLVEMVIIVAAVLAPVVVVYGIVDLRRWHRRKAAMIEHDEEGRPHMSFMVPAQKGEDTMLEVIFWPEGVTFRAHWGKLATESGNPIFKKPTNLMYIQATSLDQVFTEWKRYKEYARN